MTNKQRIFIEEYLRCWNATEAARRAKYAHPNTRGPELVVKSGIAQIIKDRIAEVAMSADEVLTRLAEQARGIPEGVIEIRAGLPFVHWEALEGKTHLIKRIRYDKDGNPEVEFYDAQAALIQLGRHHKLFTDKKEVSGKDGSPIEHIVFERIAGRDDE